MQTQAVDHKQEAKAWEVLEAYWKGDLQKDQAEHALAQIRLATKTNGKCK